LGANDPDSDSDSMVDDPRERRKMLELSSFGEDEPASTGAYRRGSKNPTGTAASDSSSKQRGSFPMASFSQTS